MSAAAASSVLARDSGLTYPSVESAEGMWLQLADGRRILDGCSGGAMTTCLGHAHPRITEAAAAQAAAIPYAYNHHFTNRPRELLADRLVALAPPMARVKLTSGGSEANEAALRLARSYHTERGDDARWRVISPAQAYHGATMGALALSGRPTLQRPHGDYLAPHLHLPPSSWRFDPTGQGALDDLDEVLAAAGAETVAAVFCEPVGGAALPGHVAPDRFWEGLAERRDRCGFLVCFDEVVSGVGRAGSWFAGEQLPIEPDIVTTGKSLGAGHAPVAATLCSARVYEAIAAGSREFDLGHTWDGAPLPCAVGLAVVDEIDARGLIGRVAERGPALREDLEAALTGNEIVREVRGRGFLLGIDLVDPGDGESILPDELRAHEIVDDAALRHGVMVTSTHSNPDGYAGDQTTIAPAYVAGDEELAMLVERVAAALMDAEREIKQALAETTPNRSG
jgi:adenosylmethionine-8-amino-7-oxononanoate aminotransferase